MKYRIMHGDVTNIINTPKEVYDYLVRKIYKRERADVDEETHLKSTDAQCWCELANAGDSYEDKDFTIECVYRFNI